MKCALRFILGSTVSTLLLVPSVRADVVTDWNNVTLNAIRATAMNPPRASRVLAMVHCAVYDAVNALEDNKYVSYAPTGQPPSGNVSIKAAAASAAYRVLVPLFPTQLAAFDTALAASLAGIPNNPLTKGVTWGNACGDTVLALRANDNSGLVVPYVPVAAPGIWVPTPPAGAPALLPNWPLVTCFTLDDAAQFRQPGPPALNSAAYTAAFNEVKDLGKSDSATRTADQTQIALFWADGGGTSTPPGHWNLIAQVISQQRGFGVLKNARLFAMLNCAMADAAISCWDNKYYFNHWRPVTGIRAADTDGNASTTGDATWLPLIVTPPFPSYTSGHSTFSGAAARTLKSVFGTNSINFTIGSDGLANVTRSFTSIDAAANEAALSRLYGGIHWNYDNNDGITAGHAIAAHLVSNFFGLLGDLNHNNQINLQDLFILLGDYGSCGGNRCPSDLNRDGVVNIIDVVILFSRWSH